MKVDFYTHNITPAQYNQPSFMARPIKVNWKSDAGKQIIKILEWMGATAMLGITAYKMNPDAQNFNDEEKEIMDSYLDFNEEEAFNQAKAILETGYRETKDEKILDKHLQLFKNAYKNRALLRGGYSELGDYELTYSLMNTTVIRALNLLGKGTLESAFSLDYQGFTNLCDNVFMMQDNISNKNFELLKKKINPESSNEYKNLEEEIKKDKRKITKLLGKENSLKRKELLEEIEVLKGDKSNAKEIKELKKQIQALYKNCENSEQIVELMAGVNDKKRKMKELAAQKVNLSPQEIINKVWTIACISKSPHYDKSLVLLPDNFYQEKLEEIISAGEHVENGRYLIEKEKAWDIIGEDAHYYLGRNKKKLNKDIKELIALIQPSTPENEKIWKNNINKKLYEYADIRYNEKYADKIDLANCKYLNELIISDQDFWDEMRYVLEDIVDHLVNFPNSSVDEAIDDFIHNVETKEIYTSNGIDYDKWAHYDKNSYIESPVTIKAEDAKQKAVSNMCEELTSKMLKNIPAKERKSLYKALGEVGVTVNKNSVKIDGRDVDFEDLDAIMSVIKAELSDSTFWSVENTNEKVEKARDTIYCHFMLQRKQEIDCAKRLKESETVDVKVQKVNMSDIKHSLCLGNHSHCCTALGSQSNEWSAPVYIINRGIGAIEVLANGEPVGNTMIYLANIEHDDESHLALVLDDIELQTKFQNNEKIKDMIIDYAKKLCAEIGKPDIPIYAGPGMHKIDMSEYPLIKSDMVILGKSPEGGGVYLDFDGGQHEIGNIKETTDLYRVA